MPDAAAEPPAEGEAPDAAAPAHHSGQPEAAPRARHQAWLQRLASEPARMDFYVTLRRFEAAHAELPRLGTAARPSDEPLRLAQPADLSFAHAALHGVSTTAEGLPRVSQRIFGLLGPNGPLPMHLSELASERQRHHGDAALQRFLDLLTHRFALLFYRAWAQAQPLLGQDRPDDTGWALRLGALSGLGSPAMLARDALGDPAKLHFTGRLARQARDAEGLQAWCRSTFDVPITLQQWCGHWMPLAPEERSRLGGGQRPRTQALGLGRGTVIGSAVWDVQHKFRLVIGPLSLARYRSFLPGGPELPRLQALVRQWLGLELQWDVQLVLDRREVPHSRLGGPPGSPSGARLGRTCWLGRYRRSTDASDLCLDVEQTLKRWQARPAARAAS